MKLLFCSKCQDVRKLQYRRVFCECGKSWGNYFEDGLNAYIGGEAVPLGFDNGSFKQALRNQPKRAPGKRFEAFVIQTECDTVIVEDGDDRIDRNQVFTMREYKEFEAWIRENLFPLVENPEYVILFDDDVVRKITFDKEPNKGRVIDLDIGWDRHHAHCWIELWEDELQSGNAIEDMKKRIRVLKKEKL